MPQDVDLSILNKPVVDDMSDQERRIYEIRAIALHALLIDGAGFSAFRYFAELKPLASPRMRGEWLEARIATCVAGRIRPAVVVRSLNLLRGFRQSRTEEDRFEAFEALLKTGLGGQRLTNHAYRAQTFGDRDHRPIWERIAGHIGFLTDQGYQVFLNSGTLLGLVRDGRLIDHDDDIDLALILKAGSHEEAAQEWNGLCTALRDSGHLDAEQPDRGILKLAGVEDVKIDLFPAWIEDGRVFIYPHSHGDLARGDVLPLTPCPVSGQPLPAESEKMLANNYGPGWRVSDPYFKFPWPSARRKFSAFLEGLE